MRALLTDTGPLVALLKRDDARHAECVAYAAGVTAPLLTTRPVLTEAAWLLRGDSRNVLELVRMVREGEVRVAELGSDAAAHFGRALVRYADQTPQLADLSLLYLADRLDLAAVFTIDRRDFAILRRENGTALTVVP